MGCQVARLLGSGRRLRTAFPGTCRLRGASRRVTCRASTTGASTRATQTTQATKRTCYPQHMGKRIFLFIVTNLAIVLTLSVVVSLLGISDGVTVGGLDLRALAIFCLVWGMVGSFISLQMSRWIAKRATGVKLVDGRSGRQELDWLYQTVERLTRQANLPMPEVGYYESPEVNAFATGPSKSRSLVAVSSGLLRSMRQEEVEGVLAHEVAHIANGDMVTMTLLQGVINAFVMFAARVIAHFMTRTGGSRDDRGGGVSFIVV